MIVESTAISCAKIGAMAVLCGLITSTFGPNIGLTEFFGCFVGTWVYYSRAKSLDITHPVAAITAFVLNVFGTLLSVQGGYSMVTANTDIAVPQAALGMCSFLLAFLLQAVLSRLLKILDQINWPWGKGNENNT
jgi:hypothetical protein